MSGRGYSIMPAGSYRGRPLVEVPTSYLRGFLAPVVARGRSAYARLLRSIELELARRRKAVRP